EKAKAAKPIALISEGTRITDEETDESERRVFAECKKIVYESDNLVLADFNFKDVDRLRTFFTIAKQTGRRFVVKLTDAYYLKYLSQDPQLNVPNFDDEDILICLPKRQTGTYSEADYSRKDKEFATLENTITAEKISERPDKYLCALGYYSFTSLIDMALKPGARYIHSSSEPYNEEQEISQERTDAWLKHFGLTKYQSHCSGHAKGSDLLKAVSDINAKTVYPVHTEHPDAFRKVSDNIVKIDEGVKYDLN
ncbi:MAG: MBL fold metallo-hydrolase RNA specificity domain-containing protein, partial [Nitrosopumilus sp.]